MPNLQTIIDDGRQPAPRHKINLERSVLATAIRKPDNGQEEYFVLQAQLLDISLTGLALTVSADDARDLRQMGEDLTLRMLLPLPAKAIELEAVLVRYERLADDEKILIGAHITDMSGSERIIFMEFIHGHESSMQ